MLRSSLTIKIIKKEYRHFKSGDENDKIKKCSQESSDRSSDTITYVTIIKEIKNISVTFFSEQGFTHRITKVEDDNDVRHLELNKTQ